MLFIPMPILAGASYRDTGGPYGEGKSSAYDFFHVTLEALNKVLAPIAFPASTTYCRNATQQFELLLRSPLQPIIPSLTESQLRYDHQRCTTRPIPVNTSTAKRFYVLCVQADFVANYQITLVSAHQAGITHDSTAFQSALLNYCEMHRA